MDFLSTTGERADLNQYWYSTKTIAALVQQALEAGGQAAFVSTPSIYFSLPDEARQRSKVLDFDRQWESDPGFVFYDFNEPEALGLDLHGQFDFILVDPPFITREVWEKYAVTTRLLAREGAKILCTTINENAPMMQEILGLQPALFRPSIPNLVYQYSIYVNYTSKRLDELNPEIDDEDWQIQKNETLQTLAAEEAPIQVNAAASSPWMPEGQPPLDVPEAPPSPDIALLIELKEKMGKIKKCLESILAPLQTAVRRQSAGGDAAATALKKVEDALSSAETCLEDFESWLYQHQNEVATILGEEGDTAAVSERWKEKDVWHLKAAKELLSKVKGNAISIDSMPAYQEFANSCRQVSTAVFRHSNSVLDKIKVLKRAAAEAA
eukprot:TRINITY_DN22426_c1_g1_i1.p1 TRINITY_DN22426_c1_g1~~TRINITY_DN22426_c1_g1_i1.p1  ORF type:complete len:382 (-),score=90.96 TRINITY_DN22426_c1_g1_i1:67-1212(-)